MTTQKSAIKDKEFKDFFYNKETPNYWKFFFFLLEKVSKKAIIATVLIVLIMNISNILDTGFKYYNHFQEKAVAAKKQEQLAVSALLNTMDYKSLLSEINDIYKEVDYVYDNALQKTTSDKTKVEIQTYYIFIKDSMKNDFQTSIKLASILEMNNDFSNTQITISEIQDSIETIRQYRVAKKLYNNVNYIRLKQYVQ